MNKIPYDGFNPLQNVAAFLVNHDIVQDPALAVVTSGSLLLGGLLIIVAAITTWLEK